MIVPLIQPARLHGRSEVLANPSPVPRCPGVYAWYFRNLPDEIPVHGCVSVQDLTLMYVGISPKSPPQNGAPQSRQSLWHRIRYHFRGNAAGSTLRLTLGTLLADQLHIGLRRVGSGGRLTFTHAGETLLSDWMAANAVVVWIEDPAPWILEQALIQDLSLPLNLQGNGAHPFHARLTALRKAQRERAAELDVVAR